MGLRSLLMQLATGAPLEPVAEPPLEAPPDWPRVEEPAPRPAPRWGARSAALEAIWPMMSGSGCDPRVAPELGYEPCVTRPTNIETLLGGFQYEGGLAQEDARWLFEQSARSSARRGLLVCRVESREAVTIDDGAPRLSVEYELLAAQPDEARGRRRVEAPRVSGGASGRAVAYVSAPLIDPALTPRLYLKLITRQERWTLAAYNDYGIIHPAREQRPVTLGRVWASLDDVARRVSHMAGVVECRFVEPALVEARLGVGLAALDAEITRWERPSAALDIHTEAQRELLRDAFDLALGRVVGLVGWADPRVIARLERALAALQPHDQRMSQAQWGAAPALSALEVGESSLSIRVVSAPPARIEDPPDDMGLGIPPDRLYLMIAPVEVEVTVSRAPWRVAPYTLALAQLPAPPRYGREQEVERLHVEVASLDGQPLDRFEAHDLAPGAALRLWFGAAGERVWLNETQPRRVWRFMVDASSVVVRSP